VEALLQAARSEYPENPDLAQAEQAYRTTSGSALALSDRLPFEPETVLIPAGPFWMGSDDGPEHERPRHEVNLPAYRIGKYPVTNTQYAEYLRRNPQAPQPDMKHWFQRQPKPGLGNFPVVNLSWQAALDYCRWLAQATGLAYSLPSEAQWEKAARGSAGRSYPWGDEWRPGCANFGGAQPTAVDAHPDGASPNGCLDLLGNVEEWTSTLWGADERTLAFPYPYRWDDGREETTVSQFRIHRGGSYRNAPQTVRATTRGAIHQESKVPWRGLRVVINLARGET
jgi:formylglycine-generating enzyme required for sulfatase activity